MLSACIEYEDILSDKQQPTSFLYLSADFERGCSAGYCGLKILILSSGGYVIRLNKKESGIRGAIPPPLGRAGVGFHLGRAGVGYHLNNSLGSWPNSSLKHLVK